MHEAVGQSQTVHDQLDPARAGALHATLSLPGTPPKAGDSLPPFWHQIHFWDARPAAMLGRDGHPTVGSGLIPDLGLPQRMWAGGRLGFDAPVILGMPAEKRSTVETVARKQGRTGPLGFVTLRHEIWQNNRLCVTEYQDIAYRTPRSDHISTKARPARTDEETVRSISFDTTLLFRYSALTFNGHRIHFDLDYARQVEGYSGLVVHGPLLAQLLMLLAEEILGKLSTFAYRATSPLIDDESASLCWRDGDLWVRGPDGRLCMEATAS
ncbi:MAG: acyl dehydratase [Paracoccaceae bacterium]